MSAIAPVGAYDAARYTGADVVLVDIERNSFHPGQEAIQKAMNEHPGTHKVYVLDHTFGSPAVVESPGDNVQIVADITGIAGAELTPDLLGAVNICGLSQYDLITTGNGAMLATSDAKLFGRIESLRYGTQTPGRICCL
jgi:dTDP-4-amino-4,6-dideoxygalactose transaminase